MSIANVTSSPVTPSDQGQGKSRLFQRVSGTSATSSFTPTTGGAPSSSTTQAPQSTQPTSQQPKAFKGRGQFVNLLV